MMKVVEVSNCLSVVCSLGVEELLFVQDGELQWNLFREEGIGS